MSARLVPTGIEYENPGIYAIRCCNGSIYVGQSHRPIKFRLSNHRSYLRAKVHKNPYLQNAWNKYGEDGFEFDVLENVSDPSALDSREQFWLDEMKRRGAVFNHGIVASSPMRGAKRSSAANEATALGNRGKIRTPEQRARLSAAVRRRVYSAEALQAKSIKISAAGKGRKATPETKAKLSKVHLGKPFSEEHKRKIANALKGKTKSDEHRSKLAIAFAGDYPALINKFTGEIIPAGKNLKAMCIARGIERSNLRRVISGKSKHCKGWMLK